jgi:flagellar biosynthetic protein FlhB
MPSLIRYPVEYAWGYCGDIIISLFWSIIILTLAIGALDYIFSFISIERKMRMSKQELKEEFKKREVDPHVKSRMRRMARDMSMSKMLEETKTATVVVMNPTHFAVALRYELGMPAPVVVAKGKDFNALRIKEVALKNEVTVLENPPLARLLYRSVEVGKEIPESLYKVVSEVIRYVFKLKGKSISR